MNSACNKKRVKELKISQKVFAYFTACNKEIFPSIHKLLKILVTLPVLTSTSERKFSTLRRLKNYLRNVTGQQRLKGLTMLNVHKEIIISSDEVLNHLAETPCRLIFRLLSRTTILCFKPVNYHTTIKSICLPIMLKISFK